MTGEADSAMEERILALEETVAHQSRMLEELSTELAEQWKLVDQMRTRIERLSDRFLALEEQSLEAPAITRPPHY